MKLSLPEHIVSVQWAVRRALVVVALFSAVINVLMLTSALYMLQVYDRVLASRSNDTLFYLTLLAVVAVGIMGFVEAIRGRIVNRVSSFVELSVGPDALERIVEASINGAMYRADVLRDLSVVRQFMGGAAMFALFDLPWAPIYIAVIFAMHPMLGFIATAGAFGLLAIALLGHWMTRDGLKEGGRLQFRVMRQVEAMSRNAEVVDAMGMLPALCRRWLADTRNAASLTERATDGVGSVSAITKAVRQILQIVMLGGGAYLVMHQEGTGGVMIAGSILLGRALAPVEQVVGAWKVLTNAREAYARVYRFFLVPANRHEAMPLPVPTGRLAAEGVTYYPPGSQTPALRNVSFAIEAGETLAIIGPSAAGKSTLARLIVGVASPRLGLVRLDGAATHSWNRAQFGQFVGYLPQDVELFAGTVAENIARFGPARPRRRSRPPRWPTYTT